MEFQSESTVLCVQLSRSLDWPTWARGTWTDIAAAGEIRPVANYVAWVIEQHLAAKPKNAKPRDADPSEERLAYDVGPFLTVPERRELERRAATERRSVSGYVTRLVVESLQP